MASKSNFDGTRILSESCVRRIGDMPEIIDAVEGAFRAYERGDAVMPPKSYIDIDEVDGDFRSMPPKVGEGAGVKWINVHPDNPDRFGLPTVMGLVVYSDPVPAYPLAVIDGTELTRLRTGAAAGVATRHLARDDVAGEIGDIVTSEPSGLRTETTVFDSTGLAIQDIATAKRLYETARANGDGTLVEIIGG